MSLPPVSVVIPAHGRPDFLLESVASAKAQTYAGPIEVIVVDDESPLDLRGPLAEHHPDVKYLRVKNGGPAAARQAGSEAASGKYIAYNDDDDLWDPEKLAIQIGFMEAHPEVRVSHTDALKFNSEGVITPSNFLKHNELFQCESTRVEGDPPVLVFAPRAYTPALLNGGPFPPAATAIRRDYLMEIGGWNRTIACCGEDVEFGLRATWNSSVAFIHKSLTRVRRHHGSNVSANVTRTYMDVVRELDKAARAYPPGLREYVQAGLGGYYARVGWMLMADKNYPVAAWHYRQALAHGVRSPGVLVRYGMCRLRGGRPTAAITQS